MTACPLPEAEEAEALQLQDELESLCETEPDDEEAAEERMQTIEKRLDEIERMSRVWPDDMKARAGAILYLAHDGTADIERGLIRDEDVEAVPGDGHGEAAARPGKPSMPASLIEELSAQKTAALRIELVQRCPSSEGSADRPQPASVDQGEHESCRALQGLEAERERIKAMLVFKRTARPAARHAGRCRRPWH